MPWIEVTEPFAQPPRSAGPLAEPGADGSIDLEGRWGSILETELRDEVDLGGCAQVEVRGSVFRASRFRAVAGIELDVASSTFVDCDLSALRFTKITNTRFEGCKLSGVDLGRALVRDVVVERSTLRLSVLRMAELERVEFRDCSLDEVDGYEVRMSDVSLPGTTLRAVELDKAHFSRVDLRGAVELDLRGCRRLDGCLLREEQLMPLVHLFAEAAGVSIEQRPESE